MALELVTNGLHLFHGHEPCLGCVKGSWLRMWVVFGRQPIPTLSCDISGVLLGLGCRLVIRAQPE